MNLSMILKPNNYNFMKQIIYPRKKRLFKYDMDFVDWFFCDNRIKALNQIKYEETNFAKILCLMVKNYLVENYLLYIFNVEMLPYQYLFFESSLSANEITKAFIDDGISFANFDKIRRLQWISVGLRLYRYNI